LAEEFDYLDLSGPDEIEEDPTPVTGAAAPREHEQARETSVVVDSDVEDDEAPPPTGCDLTIKVVSWKIVQAFKKGLHDGHDVLLNPTRCDLAPQLIERLRKSQTAAKGRGKNFSKEDLLGAIDVKKYTLKVSSVIEILKSYLDEGDYSSALYLLMAPRNTATVSHRPVELWKIGALRFLYCSSAEKQKAVQTRVSKRLIPVIFSAADLSDAELNTICKNAGFQKEAKLRVEKNLQEIFKFPVSLRRYHGAVMFEFASSNHVTGRCGPAKEALEYMNMALGHFPRSPTWISYLRFTVEFA